MATLGPILFIDDDANDAEVLTEAVKELKFELDVLHFYSGKTALEYLLTTKEQPLIIISDVRMPEMDGLSLLKQIQQNEFLKMKAIPFVFLTMLVKQEIVNEAYKFGVQGFYLKPTSFEKIKEQLYFIIHYWARSIHPNSNYFKQ